LIVGERFHLYTNSLTEAGAPELQIGH